MASQEVLTALETLHQELKKLEPAIKHVEMAEEVFKMTKNIPEKHNELIETIKENDEAHKEELTTLFEKEIYVMSEENKKLQTTTKEIQEEIKSEISELQKLKSTIKEFHDRVEKINFPERLDKIDTSITAIMSAIQSVQNRLDNLERNMFDRLKDLSDYVKETQKENKNTFLELSKSQKVLSYITWGLIIIGAATISILIKL